METFYQKYVANALLDAIKSNDIAAIDAQLSRHVAGRLVFDINVPVDNPLTYAARHAKAATVAHLISRGADVNLCPEHSDPPLSLAIQGHRLDVTETLLSHGASPYPFRQQVPYGRSTPLIAAITTGQYELAERLLSLGADINAPVKCRFGKAELNTPLAVVMGDTDIKFDTNDKYRKAAFFLIEHGGLLQREDAESRAEAVRYVVAGNRIPMDYFPGMNLFEFDKEVKRLSKNSPDRYRSVLCANADDPQWGYFAKSLGVAWEAAVEFGTNKQRNSIILDTIMMHSKGGWNKVWNQHFAHIRSTDIMGLSDTITSFTNNVVLPAYVRKIPAGKRDSINSTQVVKTLLPKVAQALWENRSLNTMVHLGDAWHRRSTELYAMRTIKPAGTWASLTDPFTASNGLQLICLTNADALRAEGLAMDNCLKTGLYVDDCMRRHIHILSVRRGDARLATARLIENQEKGAILLSTQEIAGPVNCELEEYDPAKQALEEFLALANSGQHRIDYTAIRLSRERAGRVKSDINAVIGFNPTAADSDEQLNRIFHWYAALKHRNTEHCFVPGGPARWAGKSAADFLQLMGLQDAIDELVAAEMSPAPQSWIEQQLIKRANNQNNTPPM